MKPIFAPVPAFALLGLISITPPGAAAAPPASKDAVQVQTALSGGGVSARESNLGDLVADALRQTGGAQIGLVAADEISGGAAIPAGRAGVESIVSTLRYADDASDTVVVLNLTGAQLLKVAERSVSRAPEPFDGFLQVSGLQIRYNPSQAAGGRVSLVGAGGGELDAGKTYRVATTRPIATGGLGYFQIWSQKDIAEDTGVSVAKSLKSYLAAHRTVTNTVEGRITTR